MDGFLIDYLKSGQAWILVGSGPSVEMGYPSWNELASVALETAKSEKGANSFASLEAAIRRKDFPFVFDECRKIVGGPRLLQALQEKLVPTHQSQIYKLITRWPVQVYLTTNYDDEIQRHLAELNEASVIYSNSEDHMGHLLPDLRGAIFKLHGDLRSETGLILTTSQYREIAEGDEWKYWRTKMTSVFQMNRVVVIGHSLSDRNIQHVLATAKQGAGVFQPICWLAPDVSTSQATEYLEKYRIRVISYDNRDGEHRSLVHLIETISDFVPPRQAIHVQEQIARSYQSPLGNNAGAPGFFVFNKLAVQGDHEQKRTDVVLAIIQSAIPHLKSIEPFTINKALEVAGWPKDSPLGAPFAEQVCKRAVEQGLLASSGDEFKVGDQAQTLAATNEQRFEHLRERFKTSLQLRIRKHYPALDGEESQRVASDIEASLTGYFKEGGLTLATTLFSNRQRRSQAVPSSMLKYINEASAQYDDSLRRQAFSTASIEAFVSAESAEREYLGRISQGFFAFHSLGVFGEVAIERIKEAKKTVWLIDSSAQIPTLALAASTNAVFADCFSRLKAGGVRLFTTEKLFDETREHLRFASEVIRRHGPGSSAVVAAARGETPYRKSNQFLEGFIRWQSAGNPCDWESYNFHAFGSRNPRETDIKQALSQVGIEVIDFQDWPGFTQQDRGACEEYFERIVEKIKYLRGEHKEFETADFDQPDYYKKAQPEAEALLIVRREREGTYQILSPIGEASPSWFISQTSILNVIEEGPRITWQPEAFLKFSTTLSTASDPQSANRAFETLLWGLAQSGLSLLDEKTIEDVFGGTIEQATINIVEQRQVYNKTIGQKYGESPEAVLKRVSPSYKPLAALQLANEMSQRLVQEIQQAESLAIKERKRAEQAEKMLRDLDRFRKRMEAKRQRHRRKKKK